MYFKRIEMQGFKSFAEPVVLELNEGITCIVGPNGSGKSNISDAISWVLGEQSPKMLRGGKMDEVIFAGTASRKSRGMAEVTLVLDNTTGILPVDYNEVAITRRMYRSGESEYAINNNPCRLRDIRELIMDTGIGVDGYSIIRQGKIADIISNKTESRREIFESAAGIVTYRNKKGEAERKLSSSNLQLERVNDIVGEIERRIDSLRDDSEKATEYLILRERFKELEINITLKNIEKLESNSQALETELSVSKEEVVQIKKQKEELDEKVQQIRDRNEALELEMQGLSEKQILLMDELHSLINSEKVDGERLSNLEANSIRVKEEVEFLAQKLEKERTKEASQLEIKKETDEKLLALSEEFEEKARLYEELTRLYQEAVGHAEGKKNDVFSFLTEKANKEGEAQSIEGLKESLNRRKEAILREQEQEDEANKDVVASREDLALQRNHLEQETLRLKDELVNEKARQNQLSNDERQKGRDLETLKIKMSQLLSRKKTIEEMEANYEGYNFGVKYLMKSNLSGLYGTVAELIQVPRGFEIAMETALGGNLQNIVCQKDQDAEKAIELLKENRAGRLTFLPLDSIKKSTFRRDPAISEARGFKGFAADLVTTKDVYTEVMEYLLGKVAVFDTMENAISLSKSVGGYRCVTLEGEFINANGAITGGRHKNNSANLLERKGEIESLGKDYDEMQARRFVLEKEQIDLREKIESSSEGAIEFERRLRETEMAYLTKKSHDEAFAENLTAMELRKEARLREKNNIEEEIANSDNMILELLKESKLAEEGAIETEREIEASLLKHQGQKNQLDDAGEGITRLRMAKSSWESEKQGIDAILAIIQSNMEEMKVELSEKQDRLSKYDREKQQILGGSGSNIKLVQEKEAEKAKIEEQLKSIRVDKSDVFQRLTQVSLEKEALDMRLENISSNRMEMEIRKGKNETLIDTYKEKLWEEFEISYIQAIEFRKDGFALSTALRENREIRTRIKELGEVNVGAIPEYQEVSERYEFLTEQRKDILDATDSLKKIIADTDRIIKARFKESFDQVASNFEMFFSELFGGGNAQLVLEDSEHPLESNIDIIAQPPGKKLSNISLLSGGEKTMTAIALMFAVLKTKPTPFCILDEVEAALDETNINRFIKTLHHFEDEIQFTLVTHQKATMEHADTLYGITMAEQGISKVLSLKLGDAFDLGEN